MSGVSATKIIRLPTIALEFFMGKPYKVGREVCLNLIIKIRTLQVFYM